MKRFIFGFQRRVWWPKWTPASSSCFMVTTGAVVIMVVSFPTVRRSPRPAPPEGRPGWATGELGRRRRAAWQAGGSGPEGQSRERGRRPTGGDQAFAIDPACATRVALAGTWSSDGVGQLAHATSAGALAGRQHRSGVGDGSRGARQRPSAPRPPAVDGDVRSARDHVSGERHDRVPATAAIDTAKIPSGTPSSRYRSMTASRERSARRARRRRHGRRRRTGRRPTLGAVEHDSQLDRGQPGRHLSSDRVALVRRGDRDDGATPSGRLAAVVGDLDASRNATKPSLRVRDHVDRHGRGWRPRPPADRVGQPARRLRATPGCRAACRWWRRRPRARACRGRRRAASVGEPHHGRPRYPAREVDRVDSRARRRSPNRTPPTRITRWLLVSARSTVLTAAGRVQCPWRPMPLPRRVRRRPREGLAPTSQRE